MDVRKSRARRRAMARKRGKQHDRVLQEMIRGNRLIRYWEMKGWRTYVLPLEIRR